MSVYGHYTRVVYLKKETYAFDFIFPSVVSIILYIYLCIVVMYIFTPTSQMHSSVSGTKLQINKLYIHFPLAVCPYMVVT